MTIHRFLRNTLFACGVVSAAGLVSSAATAQDTQAGQRAMAEALFRDGRELIKEGRTIEACRKFEESLRLDRVLGTLLNLAVCHDQEGKVATAWAEYTEAAERAVREGQAERATFASERAAALAPRLPRLAIMVRGAADIPGLKVTRDGTPIGSGAWNSSLPIDPGKVVVEATAPDREPWREEIRIEERDNKTVEVPPLVERPKPAPEPVVQPPAVAPKPVTPPPPPPSFWTTTRTAGLVITGTGAAVLTVGGLFGLDAMNKRSDSDAYCSGDQCTDPRGVSLNDDAKKSADIASVATGIGAAITITGVALLVFGGDSETETTSTVAATPLSRVRLTIVPGAKGASAGLGGTW